MVQIELTRIDKYSNILVYIPDSTTCVDVNIVPEKDNWWEYQHKLDTPSGIFLIKNQNFIKQQLMPSSAVFQCFILTFDRCNQLFSVIMAVARLGLG